MDATQAGDMHTCILACSRSATPTPYHLLAVGELLRALLRERSCTCDKVRKPQNSKVKLVRFDIFCKRDRDFYLTE